MRARLTPVLGAILGAVLAAAPAEAQQKRLTIDDLYDPAARVDFGRSSFGAGAVTWLNDREYVRAGTSGEAPMVRVDAASGRETPLYDRAALERAMAALPGVSVADARRLASQRPTTLNADHTALVLTFGDDLYHWTIGGGTATRLTSTTGAEREATFSPDGRLIAFVRDFNLFVVDVKGQERQLTSDGHAQLLNGVLDWVYQEEIYGRGTYRAYWWSPDSSRLVFLQLAEAPVPEFTVVDHIPYRQDVEITDYPKAGDPNPTVKLGVVRAAGGSPVWVQTTKYSPIDHLIVNVDWTPASGQVVFQVQDREQTWLDLNLADATTGAVRTVLRETTKAWVSVLGPPVWLEDGSFLWLSERSGWQHIYHYRAEGTLVAQLTDGRWEADTLYGVDEANGLVYFLGTERSHIGSDVYRVKLDGTGMTRISGPAGTHRARFSPGFAYYVGTWSDVTTPTQTRLHKADGTEVRVLTRNEVKALAEYRLATPEFLTVKARDGFEMEAMIIKPPDFDPTKRYPVYQHTYAGPHAPQVRNAWGGTNYLYHQLLAQRGIIVWICDNRSASGKGAESAWTAYLRLGESELRDIEDCLSWLKQQPWVDGTRVGLNGWSYGGFMTSYALTHSDSFAMGIAGGSVTDWRNYDSIYTERYMKMPQNNPDGYRETAPRHAAANLKGALLLLHGMIDDNVHVQNTLQFAYELQKANKPFELMLYPKSRHGVNDPSLLKHMRERMLSFTLEHLKPEGAGVGTH